MFFKRKIEIPEVPVIFNLEFKGYQQTYIGSTITWRFKYKGKDVEWSTCYDKDFKKTRLEIDSITISNGFPNRDKIINKVILPLYDKLCEEKEEQRIRAIKRTEKRIEEINKLFD